MPLSFDPGQGWVQLDPETGFPIGRILVGPEEECRIAVTGEAVAAPDPLHPAPLVLTVCSADDGALTATAFRDGAVLWEIAPSPAGAWSVRLDQGRVLATGTAEGSDTAGEIIASEQRADWTAPGGEGLEQVAAFTARIGIDGAAMVVTNESGQLLAYELAGGANTWTLPLASPDAEVRGTLADGIAVVLDSVVRERPLQPRGTQRLRVIDVTTGEVNLEVLLAEQVDAVRAVGGGRALVTVEGETLLLGDRENSPQQNARRTSARSRAFGPCRDGLRPTASFDAVLWTKNEPSARITTMKRACRVVTPAVMR